MIRRATIAVFVSVLLIMQMVPPVLQAESTEGELSDVNNSVPSSDSSGGGDADRNEYVEMW
jgi:hypothetical protein